MNFFIMKKLLVTIPKVEKTTLIKNKLTNERFLLHTFSMDAHRGVIIEWG